jgi:APA family basic amino acid/polyamine antiporter
MKNDAKSKPVDSAHFGLTTMTCVVIAGMIGSGIFTTSGFALADLQSPGRVLLAWCVGGMIALSGAIAYGELARRLPQSGGEYLYLSRLVHPFLGFLAGWISLTVGFSGSIALVALTFEEYVVPAEIRSSSLPAGTAAMSVIVVFGFGHAFLVRLFARLQNCIVGIKLIALITFLIIAVSKLSTHKWHWEPVAATSPPLLHWPTLLAMSTSVMFISLSYAGFNSAIYAASEVSRPDRTVPRSLILGTTLVTVLYLLLNLVFLTAAPATEIIASPQVAAIAAKALGGSPLELLIRTAIGLGTLSSVAGMIMIGPRVISRMADDGVFFAPFRSGTDSIRRSVLLQASLAAALVLVSNLRDLLGFLGVTLSLSSAITAATLLIPQRVRSFDGTEAIRRPSSFTLMAAAFYVFSTVILIAMMLRQDSRDLIRTAATLGSGVLIWLVMTLFRGGPMSLKNGTQEDSPFGQAPVDSRKSPK